MRQTTMLKQAEVNRKRYVVDATGLRLGRMATQVAAVLRGKDKPTYTPNVDCGDYVIIINADKVKITGKKLDQKIYFSHSYFVGGARYTTMRDMMKTKPEKVVEMAVRGMCPKGALGDKMFTKLHVYAGPDYEQKAQKPEPLTLNF